MAYASGLVNIGERMGKVVQDVSRIPIAVEQQKIWKARIADLEKAKTDLRNEVVQRLNITDPKTIDQIDGQIKLINTPEQFTQIAANWKPKLDYYAQYKQYGIETPTDPFVSAEMYAKLNDPIIEMKKKREEAQTKATAAQSAVQEGQRYNLDPDKEFVGPPPPIRYQEEALGAYGAMQAEEQVPVQGAKELQDQPAVAALPKRPEPEKGMTEYQKAMLELRRQANEIAKMKALKGDEDNFDDNLKWTQERQDEIDADHMKYSEKITKLRQARVKLRAGKTLDEKTLEFIAGEGMNAVKPDVNELSNALNNYRNLLKQVEDNRAAADETVEGMLEEKSLSRAITRGRKKKEEETRKRDEADKAVLSNALDWIRQRSPSQFYAEDATSGIQRILDQLPLEMSEATRRNVDAARSRGATEEGIYNRLLGKQ